jgi:hypothetical protein
MAFVGYEELKGLVSEFVSAAKRFAIAYVNQQAAGSQAAEAFFVAPVACKVVRAKESHKTAEATAASLSLDIVKDASGDAPGTSTTSVLAAAFDGKGAANTPQSQDGASGIELAAGDRLTYKPTAAGTELVGVIITVELEYV